MTKAHLSTIALRALTAFLSLAFLGALGFSSSSALAKEPKPLFQNDEMLKIRIEASFKELIRKAANSTAPYPATLILDGNASEQHMIALSARGNSRRGKNFCKFPPLRVEFTEKTPRDYALLQTKTAKAGYPLPSIEFLPAVLLTGIHCLQTIQCHDWPQPQSSHG